jgi:hypothetical protein
MTTAALQCRKDPLQNLINLLICDLRKGSRGTDGLRKVLFIPFTMRAILLFKKGELYPTSALWGVMSGDRPGPVEDLEDPVGVPQVGPIRDGSSSRHPKVGLRPEEGEGLASRMEVLIRTKD